MKACCSGCSRPLAAKQALDGGDLRPVVHHRQSQAGVDPPAVNQHRAGPAGALVAALLRSGQSRPFAQHVQQRRADVDGEFSMLTVDLDMYDSGVAFVVALMVVIVGAVTSGNGRPGGDGATHGERGAHECPAVESESLVHWFN